MLSLYDLFDSIISLRALCNLQTTSLHLPFVISPQFSFMFFQWWDDLFTTMKICISLSFVRVLVKENILHDCNEFIIYRRYRSAQSRANYLFLYLFATQSLFSQNMFKVFVRNLIKALSLREAAIVLIVDLKATNYGAITAAVGLYKPTRYAHKSPRRRAPSRRQKPINKVISKRERNRTGVKQTSAGSNLTCSSFFRNKDVDFVCEP